MAVRPATLSDLDDLTQILIASSNDDPCYPYRFPRKDHYPLEYKEHCKRKCREYIDTDTVIVYEVANPPNSRREKVVVAFSVWEQPQARRPKAERSQTWPRWRILPPSNKADDSKEAQQAAHRQHSRSSANATRPTRPANSPSQHNSFVQEDRSQAFREASKVAKANFFDAQYTGGYMYLKILLCHPNYRRRGAGTSLVKWGMSVAQFQGFNTALLSSPMGVPLYHKLGFQEIGRFEVKVEGDEEKLEIPAMVYRAPSPPRSRRGSRCAAEVAPTGLRKCVTNNAMLA